MFLNSETHSPPGRRTDSHFSEPNGQWDKMGFYRRPKIKLIFRSLVDSAERALELDLITDSMAKSVPCSHYYRNAFIILIRILKII